MSLAATPPHDPVVEPSHSVLLVGGGTGGHLQPGLVLRDALLQRHPNWTVQFLVMGREIEQRFLPEGIPQTALLPGSTSRPALWRADLHLTALARATAHIRRMRPNVVVLLGGYVSAITTLASLGVPMVLLEPNRVPGRAARMAGPFVKRVFLQWAPLRERTFASSKMRITGMPVSFGPLPPREQARRSLGLRPFQRTLLVLGGSLGARAINRSIMSGLDTLAAAGDVQIIHVTGVQDHEAVKKAYVSYPGPAKVISFSSRMGQLYAAADLVVARGGGMTVAELAAAGRPAVIVPYPHHRDRHQFHNAAVLEAAEAAWIVAQESCRADFVSRHVMPVLEDMTELRRRADNALMLGRPDATRRVLEELEVLLEETVSSVALTRQV